MVFDELIFKKEGEERENLEKMSLRMKVKFL